MSQIVNIVVTCTKQKTLEPPVGLQLRNVKGQTQRSRAVSWNKTLQKSKVQQISARDLYAGDHWAVARDLSACGTASRDIRVWVISAGYGLVSIDQEMCPYSATFSNPHPDTVILSESSDSPARQKSKWWNEVINLPWSGRRIRGLRDLAEKYPTAPLIIAASKNYLDAVQDDLTAAAMKLNDLNQLAVISAGTDKLSGLPGSLIPADARLQHYVGGVRRSLNVRLARYLLEQTRRGKLSASRIRSLVEPLLEAAPALQKFDRTPMTDDEVRSFILQRMQQEDRVSHTRLLRKLRADGKACEQKRFRDLFRQVEETAHG